MKRVLLVGPGNIGLDYYKILSNMNIELTVVGKSPKPDWPIEVFDKGIEVFFSIEDCFFDYAIVATNEHQLLRTTLLLLNNNIKNILIEKPAAINIEELRKIVGLANEKNANVFVAYNRRFYQSVKKCKEKIDAHQGIVNVHFDFTELINRIDFDHYTKEELAHFFLCNSSHITDTVFYLLGKPKDLHAHIEGKLEWHPTASIFAGSGMTEYAHIFSYSSNWNSGGRWGIEINLDSEKLILRPLEKLHIQRQGSLEVEEYFLENIDIDEKYKPGLFGEVESFLTHQMDLCTISEQLEHFSWYYKIAGY